MSLRTVSLRRRVTTSAIIVLGLVLVGLVLVVDATFAAQSRRDVQTALADKYRVAQNIFVKQPRIRGQEVVDRLEGRGVQAYVVTPDGKAFGHQAAEDVAHKITRELPDGSQLTLWAESSVITETQARLRRLLLLVGFGALGVTAVALVWVVRRALAPLDAMTTLARSIASGDRGHRLNPSRTDNELGRAAAAFDDMLDSLEGSEERTKRFVADAAHELRTPIAGVQAVSEALMQTGSAEDRERLNLLLVRESRRAGRLVDDLLALARIEAGLELHRERVDLLALAEAEVGRTRLVAPDFDIAASGTSAHVWGDPQRLAQVLANLADNARQATGPSGVVRLHVWSTGGYALLAVADDGPGVPPEERERIFDRLVRLDEARDRRSGGSGLGLPIARGVVRAHGGELTCIEPTTPTPSHPPTPHPSADPLTGTTAPTTNGPTEAGRPTEAEPARAGGSPEAGGSPGAGGSPEAGPVGADGRPAVGGPAWADGPGGSAGLAGPAGTGGPAETGGPAAGRLAGVGGANEVGVGEEGVVGGGVLAGLGGVGLGGAVFLLQLPLAE
ncbi:ATP-binding protein [Saccharothrix variisporea]|uniref:histidine kinase n=1 Tax=Saccharothrix variisporea TaxID=543527 RepID=A0A495X7V5_9PSEU|nr:ATP-binding protein [Saccharothrix variisporea]RKT70541.1 signal transduction histidine kinase [Saccharothrix variisporea]